MHDDDFAEALDDDARERAAGGRRRWWPLVAAIAVVAAVALVVVLAWPSDPAVAPAPGAPGASSTSPGSAPTSSAPSDLTGADLLTDPWPQRAVAGLRRDVHLTRVTRLLLTSTQVQATGRASKDDSGKSPSGWSDYLYVEDKAIDLGDALVTPASGALFDLDDVDMSTIPDLVARAPALTGFDAATNIQVIVERDTVTEGAPVRVSVYLSSTTDNHLVVADAHGAVLTTD